MAINHNGSIEHPHLLKLELNLTKPGCLGQGFSLQSCSLLFSLLGFSVPPQCQLLRSLKSEMHSAVAAYVLLPASETVPEPCCLP